MNHFELFNLPVALDIDLAALKTEFLKLQQCPNSLNALKEPPDGGSFLSVNRNRYVFSFIPIAISLR